MIRQLSSCCLYFPTAEIALWFRSRELIGSVCNIVWSAIDFLGLYDLYLPNVSYHTVDLYCEICTPGYLDDIRPNLAQRYGTKGGPSSPDPYVPAPLLWNPS